MKTLTLKLPEILEARLARELLSIPFRLEDELSAVKILLEKYNNIPLSLAGRCLVRMAEQIADSLVFTLDNDFKIYRKDRRKGYICHNPIES